MSTEDGYHLRGQRGQSKVECKEIVTCFLCLKIVRSPHLPRSSGCDGDVIPKKKEGVDKKALQALFRYLNVEGKDGLQTKVPSCKGEDGGKKEESVGRKLDASLLLCQGCSIVAGELISLVEKLELTKIWINHRMKQLVDILSRSTIGPKSRKKKWGWSEDSVASLLRTETKKKCVSKLRKTDFPRVCLERYHDDTSGIVENIHKSSVLIPTDLIKKEKDEEQIIQVPGPTLCPSDDFNQPEEYEESNNGHMDADVGPVVRVKEENSTPAPSPTPRAPRVVMLCPYCDETVTSNNGLNRHTAAVHPEQFLSSVKSAEFSEKQFKSMCQNLLNKLCESKIIDKKHSCPYCLLTYGNRIYLKAHLIHGHHSVLLEKLAQLQNGIEESGDTEDLPIATALPKPHTLTKVVPQKTKNFYCRYCSKTCITQWSLKRHVILIHRSSLSSAIPEVGSKKIPGTGTKNLKRPCEHCGVKLCIGYLKKHEKQCLASLKELESESPQKPSIHQLSIHLPWSERESEASQNETLPLDEVSWQCTECERSFATLDQLDAHRNQPHDTDTSCIKMENLARPTTSFKCSECEATFWHLGSLCRHRKKCHPDPGSRGNRPAYYKELKVKSAEEIFPCRFCGRSFNREDSLRRHLKTACKFIPACQRKHLPPPPPVLIGTKASSIASQSQCDSGCRKTGPIVLPGNDSAVGYHNEDNDYDVDNNASMIPDYDPLM